MAIEKEVSYNISNSYSTLNEITSETKNIWFVCHGLGFLSRYFIQYFNSLNPKENYIIAPQAQSKQYLNGKFTHVGASWLTKENTSFEIENVLNYLDSVYESEKITREYKFNILGYSQGVSVVTRWISIRKIYCDNLYLYAGKVPREFEEQNFKHIENIKFILGNKDEYVTEELFKKEKKYLKSIFKERITFINFEGKHEVKKNVIEKLN
jgi:predicted esterase